MGPSRPCRRCIPRHAAVTLRHSPKVEARCSDQAIFGGDNGKCWFANEFGQGGCRFYFARNRKHGAIRVQQPRRAGDAVAELDSLKDFCGVSKSEPCFRGSSCRFHEGKSEFDRIGGTVREASARLLVLVVAKSSFALRLGSAGTIYPKRNEPIRIGQDDSALLANAAMVDPPHEHGMSAGNGHFEYSFRLAVAVESPHWTHLAHRLDFVRITNSRWELHQGAAWWRRGMTSRGQA